MASIRFSAICASLLLLAGPALAEKTISEIVDESNKLLRGQSSHARIVMEIKTPKWERALDIESWNHGRDIALMRIHAPAKERGTGTLKISKELWNWLPSVERVIKIPPSMMHSSWMGSDFTYEDVVKADSIVKDYTHKLVEKKQEGAVTRYLIQADPKPDAPVVWGKILIWVDSDAAGVLPTREEDYSERGEHIRTLEFTDVKNMGGRRVPTRITCKPLRKSENRTSIHYKEIQFDVQFPKDFFSLRRLQEPLR